MSYYPEWPELFDQVLRLGKKEKEDPVKVMQDFFADYRLHECRQHLWDMVECCLTNEDMPFDEAQGRADLLQYHKELEGLLEAAWLLSQGRRGKDEGPSRSLMAPAA